jgi:hypothetical protein
MTEPPPLQALPYAADDTHVARVPWLLLGWSLGAGVLTAVQVGVEVYEYGYNYLIWKFTRSQGGLPWAPATMNVLNLLGNGTQYVAGVVLLVAGIVAWYTRRTFSAAMEWLIGTAAVLLLVGGAGHVAGSVIWVYDSDPDNVTPFQAVLWLLSVPCYQLLPPVLLLLAASRRFVTEPARRVRWVAVAIGVWGLTGLLIIVDQLIRWPMGTRPYWLPAGPLYGPTDPLPVRVADLIRNGRTAVTVFSVAAAFVAAVLLRRGSPKRHGWLAAFAISWTLGVAISVADNVLYAVGGGRHWSTVPAPVANEWFTLSVAAVAALAAGRRGGEPSPPEP